MSDRRGAIAGVIAGVVLGAASVAGTGALRGSSDDALTGTPEIACKTSGGTIACALRDGSGYGVGINDSAVVVIDMSDGRDVFTRYQP